MPGLFLSYRRSDTRADAGRLYGLLANHFGGGEVFRDIEDLAVGLDFRRQTGINT